MINMVIDLKKDVLVFWDRKIRKRLNSVESYAKRYAAKELAKLR